jgi:hypothetical protein
MPGPGEGGLSLPESGWKILHTYNIKSYIFYETQTFSNSSLPHLDCTSGYLVVVA